MKINIKQVLINLSHKPNVMTFLLMLLVTLPHFKYIPVGSIAAIIALSLWKSLIITKRQYYPRKLISVSLTLLAVVLIYRHGHGFSGIKSGSHLLIVMTFFKLIESKTSRDHMLLIMLSFFIISTNFLFSQTLFIALYMFFCIFITLFTLVTISQKKSVIKSSDKTSISLKLIGYSLPLMIILFLFFPRINGPLWKTQTNESQAKTGLSDSMEPGQISKLIYSNDLVFRATFKNQIPPPHQLYWRALTLWNFDGRKWSMNTVSEPETTLSINSTSHEYTITIEPNKKKWLFLLDLPYKINNGYKINPDFTAQAPHPISKLLQYSASASRDYRINTKLNYPIRNIALNTPGLNLKTKKLALLWIKNSIKPEEIVNSALKYFSKQGFYYTLSPAQLTRSDGIDQFLFETREGFCEHYASAFAVLMRSAGIPTRIVLGYLGGTHNPLDNVVSVDQSMAHAWNEVWIEGKGWLRVDPTASISPDRVNKDINTALKDQAGIPLHLQIDFSGFIKIKQILSAIDVKWNEWVLSYDKNKQRNFLQFLTGKKLSFVDISGIFLQLILLSLVLTSLVYFYNHRQKKKDPIIKAYKQFLRKLEKAGYTKPKHLGPRDFKQQLVNELPALKQQISFIIEHYVKLRFRDDKDDITARRFIRAVKLFSIKKSNYRQHS